MCITERRHIQCEILNENTKMENLINQFEKESGLKATIESDLYADGEIYAKEYTEWLEKRIQALSMSGVSESWLDSKWNEYRLLTNNEDAWCFKEWLKSHVR